MFDILVRRLSTFSSLDASQEAELAALPCRISDISAGHDIVREGDRPSRCTVILDGITCSSKVSADGRRQITAFHLAGDFPDLQSLFISPMDSTLAAVSKCKVGFVDHEDLRNLVAEDPRLADVLWRSTLIEMSIYREWVANIGSRAAYARVAHLFCELVTRLAAVGLADRTTCHLPLSQVVLADATGMSTVHVNRTLKEIRELGIARLRDSQLHILDWDRLVEVGEFDPSYLHLRSPASAQDALGAA